jgi:hemolysin-activating ACP:hemolysin acyltransferase
MSKAKKNTGPKRKSSGAKSRKDARGARAADAANDAFVSKSLRHLAELRQTTPNTTQPNQPFPEGWFDIPERQLADVGAMFFLMSLSPYHRPRATAQAIASLEPPLRLGQYHIFRTDGYPRAFVTWAGLDVATERQFAVDHLPLRPEQWNIGTSKWVVDLVAPFGHIEQVIRQLAKSEKANRVRTLWHNRKGTRARVIQWQRPAQGGDIQVTSYGQSQFEQRLQGE